MLGAGIGSQIFIGQLLAFSAGVQDFSTIVLATVLAALASLVPRMLSGPAEQPALAPATAPPADASAFFSE